VAVAVTRNEPPEVLLAEDEHVLGRLIALRLVAHTRPGALGHQLEGIGAALLDERWADAVTHWMEATGTVIDAYPDEEVWTEEQLDQDRASFEVRVAPIFK